MDKLVIKGAREHNLKNIDLELPRDKLIVISGLSGSGKSSLAFDTIFAEGQRRYVESLSSYARMFLGRMDKPDVDNIDGLSPAISIEQKTTGRNPRSTVGTITEIYDYFRLLFARAGTPHCPQCGKVIREQSVDQIIDAVMTYPLNSKIMILAPTVSGKKGEHQKILDDARKSGFIRVRINDKFVLLEDEISLDKKRKHSIDIVVDRLIIDKGIRTRLSESIESALEVSDGKVIILETDKNEEQLFSQKTSCPDCNISIPELQPRLFSFNNPFGACDVCTGLGVTLEFDRNLMMPDLSLSFNEGGILPYNPDSAWNKSIFQSLAKHFKFSLDTPLADLKPEVMNAILFGTEKAISITYVNKAKTGKFEYESNFKGILKDLKRRYMESSSEGVKDWLEQYMNHKDCPACNGKRLNKAALGVTIGDKNIIDLSSLSVKECIRFFNNVKLTETEAAISKQILKEIRERLSFMANVGLEYLTLERRAGTLSGGEAQRIRLATQIGSSLMGVLYILDEPTIGLHQRDNQKLIDTLVHLRNLGNTLIIVEHDEQTILTADYVVDLGPGAGIHGGEIVAQGTVKQIMANPKSPTGRFLSGKDKIEVPKERRNGNGQFIEVKKAREHNLKNIDVKIPLGTFTVITGVSGSGKSTLMSDILYPALQNKISRTNHATGRHDRINGSQYIDKVINIDQSAIGRTPRSNPATFVGLFGPIRDLFSSLPESKARGFKPGRFSFNVKGGRCENCEGDGTIKIEMHFLPDVYIVCDVCKGKRFNKETLDVRFKGKNIHDVLEMSIEEALEFFTSIPKIRNKLETLNSVGLGYVKLGQSALTLSGGEAQRVKLSLELSRRATGKTFYILDEPTTGLHFADVKKLLEVLKLLVDMGNTVVLIEHNLDVIKQCDYIIDLGPEGGDEGGTVVITGTPEEVAAFPGSYTGQYLKTELEKKY